MVVKIKIVLVVIIVSNLCLSQDNSFRKIILKDSMKFEQKFNSDSVLVGLKTYNIDEKGSFTIHQKVKFDEKGNIISLYSYEVKKYTSEGVRVTEFLIVDLLKSGKPKRIYWSNKFKLFRNYVYNSEKRKYKRIRR